MAKNVKTAATSRASKLNEGKVQVMRTAVANWYDGETDARKRFDALCKAVRDLGIKSKEQFKEWRMEACATYASRSLARNPAAKDWHNLKEEVALARGRGILSSKGERTKEEATAAATARTQIARLYEPCNLKQFASKQGGAKNGAKGGATKAANNGTAKATAPATAPAATIVAAPETPHKVGRREYVEHVRTQIAALLAFHNKHAGVSYAPFGTILERASASVQAAKQGADEWSDAGETDAQGNAPKATGKPRKSRK